MGVICTTVRTRNDEKISRKITELVKLPGRERRGDTGSKAVIL